MRQRWIDEHHMRRALSLAWRGLGRTSPNPMVGCVIVNDGVVVGQGYHKACGMDHAEPMALAGAGPRARGATAYVTLEPCSHQGRTPPCAPRLIEAGIRRCVIALIDPNPKVSGRGVALLRQAGIDVVTGVLEQEARWINRGFLSLQRRGIPWITLKAAASLDGDLALADGQSRWITGELARQKAHMLRAENDAILVGSATLIQDNPALTVRATEGLSPRPILVDGQFSKVAPHCAALTDQALVYGLQGAAVPEWLASRARFVPADAAGKPDLGAIFRDLAQQGVARLMIEGGGTLISSCLAGGYGDEVALFVAPTFLGRGKTLTGGLKLKTMAERRDVRILSVRDCDGDLWIHGGMACSLDWLRQ